MTKEEKVIYDRERYRRNATAVKARVVKWRLDNPEKVLAYGRRWKKKNKPAVQKYGKQRYANRQEQQTAYARQKKYGVTPEQYQQMLEVQAHACALCGRLDRDCIRGGLCIDHCHQSTKVRSLLCHMCNGGLGFFQESPILLRKAADYLETHKKCLPHDIS